MSDSAALPTVRLPAWRLASLLLEGAVRGSNSGCHGSAITRSGQQKGVLCVSYGGMGWPGFWPTILSTHAQARGKYGAVRARMRTQRRCKDVKKDDDNDGDDVDDDDDADED